MNNLKRQIIVFFIGLFTILFLLEAGLRIVGAIYRESMSPAGKALCFGPGEKSYTILCLGNSWTAGGGAPKGQSYPDHLQRLLDKKFNKSVIAVINGGVGNENSSELLYKLEANLNKVKPDMVILQTGQPNWWNFYKYNNYLKRENGGSANPMFSVNDFISNSRVYRLVFLLYSDMRNKKAAKVRRLNSSYEEGKLRREFIEQIRNGKKEIFLDKQKSQEALNCFKKMIKLDPDYPKNYFYIGEIYLFQRNYEEALNWFIKAVEIGPDFRDGQENKSYARIRSMRKRYKGEKDEIINKKIDAFIEKFNKTNPANSYNFMLLTDSDIRRWIESDVREIIRVIQNKNIKIILQNYPFKSKGYAVLINSTLRNIAEDLNIPFVDNVAIFQQMMDSGARSEDYYVPDGHCSARGYEVIAKDVYDKVLEQVSDLNKGNKDDK